MSWFRRPGTRQGAPTPGDVPGSVWQGSTADPAATDEELAILDRIVREGHLGREARREGRPDLETLREALFHRVEPYLRRTFWSLDYAELLDAVAAASPAETVARAISAKPDIGIERDDWTDSLLRGTAARQSALQTAGGALSSGEVAELLGISVAAVKQRQRRGGLLAIPLANGEWGYPARQFAPGGRVRQGLREVLAAFGADEDPWVVLTFLANPDPVTGEGMAFDALDDPDRTRALAELARTFWEQGAA